MSHCDKHGPTEYDSSPIAHTLYLYPSLAPSLVHAPSHGPSLDSHQTEPNSPDSSPALFLFLSLSPSLDDAT